MRLCASCRIESEAWLDYQPAQSCRFANNAAFDDTPSGMREISGARFADWRETVRFQQNLIREQCARDHQSHQLKVGSLFTGYGGLDHAARAVFGGELAWVSDNHPSAVKLLAHRHPDVPNLGDITTIDWNDVQPVDLLTAGFPCQDISNAGKRAGIEGERSGLWSYVADAVRVLRPRHVVLENVSALLVRGLDRVAADLAEVRYDLRWTCIRASDVGAPHRRERWFGVAEDANRPARSERRLAAPGQAESRRARTDLGVRSGTPASDTEGDGRHEGRPKPARFLGGSHAPVSGDEATADTYRGGLREQPVSECWSGRATVTVEYGAHDPVADTNGARQQQRDGHVADVAGRLDDSVAEVDWGQFGPAIHRWEAILGRRAPEPTRPGRNGNRVLSPRFVEWMQGVEPGWVTNVPGLSRSDMLRLLGNGVVPRQGGAALWWLSAQELPEAA
jgi:DNA (cytosine-5)-methyltransferase 1